MKWAKSSSSNRFTELPLTAVLIQSLLRLTGMQPWKTWGSGTSVGFVDVSWCSMMKFVEIYQFVSLLKWKRKSIKPPIVYLFMPWWIASRWNVAFHEWCVEARANIALCDWQIWGAQLTQQVLAIWWLRPSATTISWIHRHAHLKLLITWHQKWPLDVRAASSQSSVCTWIQRVVVVSKYISVYIYISIIRYTHI